MNTIDFDDINHTIKIMLLTYRFNNYPNIVCSGSKIYQLPCCIGKKSFGLRELKPKYHQGSIIYLINSKRINSKTLKRNAVKVNEKFILSKNTFCPF
jgi:hypothetical protein